MCTCERQTEPAYKTRKYAGLDIQQLLRQDQHHQDHEVKYQDQDLAGYHDCEVQ